MKRYMVPGKACIMNYNDRARRTTPFTEERYRYSSQYAMKMYHCARGKDAYTEMERHVQQIYHNCVVATVDPDFHFAEAVAVNDGIIAAVGTEAEIMALSGPETEMIDLHGALMLPGIHDAHLHASDFVHNLDHLACDRFTSISALQDALARRWAERQEDWILGNGVPQGLLDAGLDRHALDSVVPDTPVILIMWHGHGCVANTAALQRNGITAATEDPPGGIIRRETDGTPNGVMEEASALQLMFTRMPPLSTESIADNLEKMQHLMNSMGYTAFTDSTVGPGNDLREGGASGHRCLEAYQKLLAEGRMTCRVSVGYYSGYGGKQSRKMVEEALASNVIPKSTDETWLSFHMLKFFCDGVETSHTAWMEQDYADAPGVHGRSCLGAPEDDETVQVSELRDIVRLVHDAGYQLGIHTVGDRAVREAAEALFAAHDANPRENCRHCLIHADVFGAPEVLARCQEYGFVVSSQPNLTAEGFLRAAECVGKELNNRSMPLRTLVDSGLVLAGGSDSIAGEFHGWLEGLRSATLREASDGRPFHPEYALTLEEAVRMYTINGAYQEFADDIRGSIEPGKLADFTVLDRNIFENSLEDLTNARVLRTIVGGKTVYLCDE